MKCKCGARAVIRDKDCTSGTCHKQRKDNKCCILSCNYSKNAGMNAGFLCKHHSSKWQEDTDRDWSYFTSKIS